MRILSLSFAIAAILFGSISCDTSEADEIPQVVDIIHYGTSDGHARNQVQTIANCPDGTTWLGYGISGGGITSFDGQNWQTLTQDDGLDRNHIYALACDGNNHVWIGFQGGGLSVYDGASFTTYMKSDGLTSNFIATISIDKNNNLWIGYGGNGSGTDLVPQTALGL